MTEDTQKVAEKYLYSGSWAIRKPSHKKATPTTPQQYVLLLLTFLITSISTALATACLMAMAVGLWDYIAH